MSWGQWHYSQAELGTDTCHAGPYMGFSVSPILSYCPQDAGGSIPDPFSLPGVMAVAHSSLHSMAPSPAMPCHLAPCCVTLCHAVSHCVTLCCPQTPLQTTAQSSLELLKAMCPWHAPHHDQD